MNRSFIFRMQKKVAFAAITASTVRGQRGGTLKKVRSFLTRLPLRTVRTMTAKTFVPWLDKRTVAMGVPWGVSRKCLNIFLRDAFYNRYLCREYGLHRLEKWLEVPLDSIVAQFLIENDRGPGTGVWPGLKWLKAKKNRAFQEVATEVAAREGTARVHLDILVWPNRRKANAKAGRKAKR